MAQPGNVQQITTSLLIYRALLVLIAPALIGYTLWRGARGGGARYVWQRLGMRVPDCNSPVWIHCASVGEVNAALPLIEAIRRRHPTVSLVVTTNTPTGARTLSSKMRERIAHAYLPLDLHGAVARFIHELKPRCALIMETELWPNLYRQCALSGIPLVLINARLSRRTLKLPAPVGELYRRTLAQVTAILARSETDRCRFERLGAPPERIQVVGNIKFALAPADDPQALPDLVGRPYWLAASTHHDEELRIARAWLRLRDTSQVLVIAPRHPERGARISAQLATLEVDIAVRSRDQPVTTSTRIYLADTLGELSALMAHARFVLLGGSLIPRGGHNVLEPARLGKAILVGPHTHNFADEVEELRGAQAIVTLNDGEDLSLAIERLLNDQDKRDGLGKRAAALLANQVDIVQVYLDRLEFLCDLG